jgi:UDP-GlcNAc:undecaprenyl-phosphate/decaprenyl-phosphate GlcNAc-1-phosphate transferase
MFWPVLATFGCPLVISGLVTAVLLRGARRLGLVDQPSPRKYHTRPTPRGGGLAIYAALALTVCVVGDVRTSEMVATLGFGLVIVSLGLLDDLRPLPWHVRLAVQTAATCLIVFWLLSSSVPSTPYSVLGTEYPGLSTPRSVLYKAAAVLWVVGLVNAFNMLDNMDALSAGVAWIAAAFFAAALLLRQEGLRDWRPALPFLMFMGALAGFLWFNRPPARIFMGDAGSTFLGFFLGVRSLDRGLVDDALPQTWAVPLCVLAVPWYDLASVVALRLWQSRSPFRADKQHLSHRLVQLGLTSRAAVGVIYLLGLASGLAALLLYLVPETAALLVVGQLACWWTVLAALEYFGHYRRWSAAADRTEQNGGRGA